MNTDELLLIIYRQYGRLTPDQLVKKRDRFNKLFDAMINGNQASKPLGEAEFKEVTGITLPLSTTPDDDGSFFGG